VRYTRLQCPNCLVEATSYTIESQLNAKILERYKFETDQLPFVLLEEFRVMNALGASADVLCWAPKLKITGSITSKGLPPVLVTLLADYWSVEVRGGS
jgi:hypothetical protein